MGGGSRSPAPRVEGIWVMFLKVRGFLLLPMNATVSTVFLLNSPLLLRYVISQIRLSIPKILFETKRIH